MSFEFPISNFANRCHDLKWFILPIPTENGFHCESCITSFPYTKNGLVLGSIVDRKPSENYMKHCPGRVLPCCISCGIDNGIVTESQIDDITEKEVQGNELLWEEELREIEQFVSQVNSLILKGMKNG